MRKFLLAVNLLVSVSAFAQCDYSKNTVDEFTGAVIKTLNAQTIAQLYGDNQYHQIDFALGRFDDVLTLMVVYQRSVYGSARPFCFNDKSSLSIKFTNGEILTLPYAGEIECSSKIIAGHFIITAEILETLVAQEMDKLRLQTTEFQTDFQVGVPLKKNFFLTGNKKADTKHYFRSVSACLD